MDELMKIVKEHLALSASILKQAVRECWLFECSIVNYTKLTVNGHLSLPTMIGSVTPLCCMNNERFYISSNTRQPPFWCNGKDQTILEETNCPQSTTLMIWMQAFSDWIGIRQHELWFHTRTTINNQSGKENKKDVCKQTIKKITSNNKPCGTVANKTKFNWWRWSSLAWVLSAQASNVDIDQNLLVSSPDEMPKWHQKLSFGLFAICFMGH